MADFTLFDGTERSDYTWQDGMQLVRKHTSMNEDAIMRENAAVRSAGGVRDLSFGKMIFQMSQAQYKFLTTVNPALKSRDPVERTRAWKKLSQDGGYRNLQVEDH